MTGSDSSLSRRTFAQGAALSAAAAAATPTGLLGATRTGPAASRGGHGDGVIRIGLIGCGGRGTGAALQALQTEGAVELVAMGDAFEDRARSSLAEIQKRDKLAAKIKVTPETTFIGFDAFEKVLGAGVDVVILATPPHFRPDQFRAAIAAGKHVFMEKPVAVDGHGVRTVLEAAAAAKQKDLKVGVGLQRHHDRGYQEVIQRVHDGQIGDIVAARAYWNMGFLWSKERQTGWSDMEWQLRNWLYFTWLSGDHIVEQHIHNMDVINWAKQAHPVRAHGMGGRQIRTDERFGHIFDHHAVQFEYEDGTYMFSECRQIAGCMNKVSEHLIGTKGTVDFENGYHIHGENPFRFKGKRGNPYQVEHDELFAAIRNGTEHNEAVYGAESTMTAIMGRMATYTGRIVTWDEALASERLGPTEYGWTELAVPPVPRPGS